MTIAQSPHSEPNPPRAERVDLAGRYGPVAALRASSTSPLCTALLVPGYTGCKEDFVPLLAELAGSGIDVVAIDLPGQYESPGPAREDAYLPAALGTVIAELVEKLAAGDRKVVLLGHSFGGLVARGAVLAGAAVAGLTLLDSGPSALPEGPRSAALVTGQPLLRERGIAAAWELRSAVAEQSPGWRSKPQQVKDFERTVFLSSTPAGLLGMGAALLTEPDLVDELAAKLREDSVPCAVLCGADDDAWSPTAQREMAARLGATFHTVPAARHSPNVENPAGLLDVLIPTWREWAWGLGVLKTPEPLVPPEEPQ
ncbi:MAG: alpha/beta fold hydrolase [Sciscionella sp.]